MEASVQNAKSKKLIVAVCIVLVAALLISAVLFSELYKPEKTKEQLLSAIERTPKDARYVADYLTFWGFPEFDAVKLKTIESRYISYYYKTLPDTAVVARDAARVFIDELFDVIDINDQSLVTEAYAACYIYAVGDTYGYYRTKEQTESFLDGMSGEFVGIGVVVRNETITGIPIIEILDSSPAKAAGLMVGDYIISVDGVSAVGADYVEIVNKIRGTEGTPVTVRVRRGEDELDFTMNRAKVKEVTVSAEMLEGNVGYINISQFKASTAGEFKEKLDYLVASGAVGIVFDLSQNPGGYLTAVCDVMSYLVPTGTPLVSFSSFKEKIDAYDGTALEPTDNTLKLPCAVICSSMTASAAELFTGAVRDFNTLGLIEAVTVGEKTFQKGVMQTSFGVGDGDTVTLTTAYYYSPLSDPSSEAGVVPDIAVDSADKYISVAIEELTKLINN